MASIWNIFGIFQSSPLSKILNFNALLLFSFSFTPFNLFLDTKREPKEIQEEVLKKKLALTHPFKGQLDGHLEFPNAHSPQPRKPSDAKIHGSWRLREIERERLRQGYYKDMDWTALRRDPSNA